MRVFLLVSVLGDLRSENVIRRLPRRRRRRKFLRETARAWQWIEQKFLRLFHPQTVVFAGAAPGHHGVRLDERPLFCGDRALRRVCVVCTFEDSREYIGSI